MSIKLFEQYKHLVADEGKPFKNDDEAWESYHRLEALVDVFFDMALEDIGKGRKPPAEHT